MKSTAITPDTLLETQLNSHNEWRKAMADILLASKQQLLGTICKTYFLLTCYQKTIAL